MLAIIRGSSRAQRTGQALARHYAPIRLRKKPPLPAHSIGLIAKSSNTSISVYYPGKRKLGGCDMNFRSHLRPG